MIPDFSWPIKSNTLEYCVIRNYTVACKISLLQDIVIHRMNLGLKLITWIRALFDILNLRENILNVSVTIGCEKSGCRLKDMLFETHTHTLLLCFLRMNLSSSVYNFSKNCERPNHDLEAFWGSVNYLLLSTSKRISLEFEDIRSGNWISNLTMRSPLLELSLG